MEEELGFAPDGQKPKNVKKHNTNLIISMLRVYGTISKTQMADLTSLSKTTISKVFSYLEKKGVIIPIGQGTSTDEGGKKPVLYALNSDYRYEILLSLGFNDHISCTVMDFTGKEVVYNRVSTPADISYKEALQIAGPLIMKTVEETGIPFEKFCGLAISYDGIVDTNNGTILNSANHDWDGEQKVCEDLKAMLPFDIHIVIDNACCFAGYAELSNRDMLLGNKMVITWDTDRTLGCSMLVGQKLVVNNEGITGGFGHVLIDTASPIMCRCGRRGCLQSVLSRDAMMEYISRRNPVYPDSLITQKYYSGDVDMKDVFVLAKQGDAFALDLLSHIVRYFSILIYNVFSLNSAQKVILQGIFSLSGDLFLNQLKEQLVNFNELHVFRNIDIVYSKYNMETDTNPYMEGAAMYLTDAYLEAIGEI